MNKFNNEDREIKYVFMQSKHSNLWLVCLGLSVTSVCLGGWPWCWSDADRSLWEAPKGAA